MLLGRGSQRMEMSQWHVRGMCKCVLSVCVCMLSVCACWVMSEHLHYTCIHTHVCTCTTPSGLLKQSFKMLQAGMDFLFFYICRILPAVIPDVDLNVH